MFSREKLKRILKDNQVDFIKSNNVKHYFKAALTNQQDQQEVQKSCKEQKPKTLNGTEKVEDVENTPALTGTLTLRKSKTPVESVFMNESLFNAIKPNKNYAVEETEDKIKNSTEDTFHRAARPSECFGVLPVAGILNRDPNCLKFSFKSPQFIFTLFIFSSEGLFTYKMVNFLLGLGLTATNIAGIAFYSFSQFSTLLFILLAHCWPKIMRHWQRVENIFTQKPYEMFKKSLARRIRTSATIIIIGMTVEHALYLSSSIITYKRGIEICASVRNYTETASFKDFVYKNYSFIAPTIPFNMFTAIYILFVNVTCTFVWNFMDLFIMMVSKGIAYRFEQINQRINKLRDKEIPEAVFSEIREHYVKLCELCELIDDNLSGIILLSSGNNLYYVCFQLLNIFKKLRWPINYIYFWYSLLYLLGRTVFVFLTAAAINDESKGGLPILRRISSRSWCVEVERLIFEMTTQTVALSGKKFYFLTRGLLFAMAGTVVTYELVLLSFDKPNRIRGLGPLCA